MNKTRTNKTRTTRSMIIISMFFIHALASTGGAGEVGEIVVWGFDNYGLVSDAPAGNDYVAVAGGGLHCVAIKSDGSLVAWGDDTVGQVRDTPAGNDFAAVTAGGSYSVALKTDGSLIAWGYDSDGVVSKTPAGNDFMSVSSGRYHSIALKSDGSLIAWGRDIFGQVSDTPTGNDFIAVAAGYDHNVALKSDGSLVAWGYDDWTQVSDTPAGNDFVGVAAGYLHSVALRSDGSLIAWGGDSVGQVSDTPTGNSFVAVIAGSSHSVALKSDGSLVAWGRDKYGQVSGTPSGNDFITVASRNNHNVALKKTTISPTYTLTTSVNPAVISGYVIKNPDKSVYSANESVQLTAIANSGYTFSHWSGDISSYSDSVTIVMNSNKSVTANFTAITKPTVSVTATDSSAGEPSNDGSFRITRTGDTSGNLLVYYSISGTASAGTDYAALSGYVNILSGQYSASIYVDVIDDGTVENSETANLTISSNAAYTVGSPSSATVTITDDDEEPPVDETIVTITAPDASAAEPANDGYFIISRTGDISSSLRVYYVASGSTAFPGTDYESIPSYVDILSGQSSASIPVVVIDDSTIENSETVQLTIWSISAYTIGSPSSATVTIADDDSTPIENPVVTISAPDASAGEPSNDGYFRVSRTGDTSSSLRVYYSTGGSTASPGADYATLSGYVDILYGQSSANVSVAVIDDYTVESSETVRLTISSNTAYDIGSSSYATVTITDDDDIPVEKPVVTITAPDASAGEPANDGYFRLSRTGDTSSSLLVYFSTSGSTASPGADYTALPGYVYIPSGQSYTYVDVIVIDDGTMEDSETVRLTISSNTAYDIGSPSYATVTITDNDDVPDPPVTDIVQMMADTLTYFYASVDDGSLVGAGKGKNNLVSFKKMLETAYDQIVNGDYTGACGQLSDALSRCDGYDVPSDYVAGSATSTLEAMIQEVINELGC